MTRPSKRIPYKKSKYIQKSILKRKSMNPVIQLMFFTISHHTKNRGPCTPAYKGGRKTTAGVLEGFAPLARFMEEEENAPSRSTPEEKKGAKNDDGRTRRLRPSRSTPEENRGRKTTADYLESPNGQSPFEAARKPKACTQQIGVSANRISPPRRAPRRSRPPAPRDKKRKASIPPPLSPFSCISLIFEDFAWGTGEGTIETRL